MSKSPRKKDFINSSLEGDNYPKELPSDCPVVALGKNGNDIYLLDAVNQVVKLRPRDISRNYISSLFAPHQNYLLEFWPTIKKIAGSDDYKVDGFKPDKVADAILHSAAAKGIWRDAEKVRGSGGWRDGEYLYLHCGNKIYSSKGDDHKPSPIGDYIYQAEQPLPHPFILKASKDMKVFNKEQKPSQAAHDLLELFHEWNWERGQDDARLLLGWIAASIMAGALDWRPMIFITGDRATGKSTIHKIIKYIFGSGLIQTADSSAAGIYQMVKYSCLPIAIDEFESDDDNRKQLAIIKLARLASSGSQMLRGSADHNVISFKARSTFLFSAINVPPLEPQDRSRIGILSLKRLEVGKKSPEISKSVINQWGAEFKAQILKEFHRFDETLEKYQIALVAKGHDARFADQYGTLLACADMLLYDGIPDSDTIDQACEGFEVETIKDNSEVKSNADACLEHLAQSQIHGYRAGVNNTISQLLSEIIKPEDAYQNQRLLASAGMTFKEIMEDVEGTKDRVKKQYLAVAQSHPQLYEVFNGTSWAGKQGRIGIWKQALARLDGVKERIIKIGGRSTRCQLIPIELVMSSDDVDE